MKLVIIESPYAGEVDTNVDYARLCVRDSLKRGEAPIASHLLYTQPKVLDDNVPGERALGIAAGLAWRKVADLTAVYTNLGISKGMVAAINSAIEDGRMVELRRLEGASC